jgi:four helix bundle protein
VLREWCLVGGEAGLAGVESYQDLLIWQKSMELCELVYRFVARLPKYELYGLSSQLKRATVSVPSNIAEGFARELPGAFLSHLCIAQGSLKELETQVLICKRVGLASGPDMDLILSLLNEVGRMVRGFSRSLRD